MLHQLKLEKRRKRISAASQIVSHAWHAACAGTNDRQTRMLVAPHHRRERDRKAKNMEENSPIIKALAGVEAFPNDPDRQKALADAITYEAERNPEFRATLTQQVGECLAEMDPEACAALAQKVDTGVAEMKSGK